MMYAKLNGNGQIAVAPRTIGYHGMTVANPTEEMLRALGYLPLVKADPPQTDSKHYPASHWEQRGGTIQQVWEVKEIPVTEELTDDELGRMVREELYDADEKK